MRRPGPGPGRFARVAVVARNGAHADAAER
jgi:hypothetical protein